MNQMPSHNFFFLKRSSKKKGMELGKLHRDLTARSAGNGHALHGRALGREHPNKLGSGIP